MTKFSDRSVLFSALRSRKISFHYVGSSSKSFKIIPEAFLWWRAVPSTSKTRISATYTHWLGAIIITAAPSQLATMWRSLIFVIYNVKMLSFECFWLIQANPVIAVIWLLSGYKKGESRRKREEREYPRGSARLQGEDAVL